MPPLNPPLPPKATDPTISGDDAVAGRFGREGVVAQRVADGSRRAVQVVGEREVGCVVARGNLAEGYQDTFAEGGEGWVELDF